MADEELVRALEEAEKASQRAEIEKATADIASLGGTVQQALGQSSQHAVRHQGGEDSLNYATTAEIADVSTVESAGTSLLVPRGDHVHAIASSTIDHGGTGGLTDDDHTQYALLAGRVGNQALQGGTLTGGTLTLDSTAHATKGAIVIASNNPIMLISQASPGNTANSAFFFVYRDSTLGDIVRRSSTGVVRHMELDVATKGDVQTYGSAPAALAVGADRKILEAASGETTGLIWRTNERIMSISIENPTSTENSTIGFFFSAITIIEVQAVVIGSASPSVTIQPQQGTDRTSGTNILSSATAITNTTGGQNLTSFNDATVPADSFVWLTTTAKSGTVTELHVTLRYTYD